MSTHLTVVGDCLLDRDVIGRATRFTPDGPAPVLDERRVDARPGGAGLAAVLAAGDGLRVTLVTALADDRAGDELRELLAAGGVELVDLGLQGRTSEKIRLRADDVSLARWDRGDRTLPTDVGPWSAAAGDAVRHADAVLVSCYGRGVAGVAAVRAALQEASRDAPVTWDPHPHGPDPTPGATVVTPNDAEAAQQVPDVRGDGLDAVTARAEQLVRRWQVDGVAVTLGERGALYTSATGMPMVAPASATSTGDPCGAGDRFAATLAALLGQGQAPSRAVTAAVRSASGFVAAGGAASVRVGAPAEDSLPARDPLALVENVRARGGRVVATGGCFDLVHAGHVHLLQAARELGDCLVVLLNSDASVRRLKGSDRPIVAQEDRAELLRALGCVDAVVVFDEDTPAQVLQKVRPHVFAKGGDYEATRIPEADVLASWGGQAVTLPYLENRSTSRILQEVRNSG